MAALVDGSSMALGPGQGPMGTLGQEQEGKIQEYEKIIQFRDAVLAGKHPRIKLPAHLLPKSPKSRALSTSAIQQSSQHLQQQQAINGSRVTENQRNFVDMGRHPPQFMNLPGLDFPQGGIGNAPQGDKMPFAGRPEINPIFLEKSDELVRAEFMIKRGRVEQRLKEQAEDQRLHKVELQRATDAAPNFHLVDVLQQALVHVQAALPKTTDAQAAASKSAAADDSFDENTFYSSNFSTPNSAHLARVPDARSEDEDVQMEESSDYEPDADSDSVSKPTSAAPPTNTGNNQSAHAVIPPAQIPRFPQDVDDRPPAHANNRPPIDILDQMAPNAQYSQTRPPNHRVSQMIGSNSHESGEASTSSGVTDNEGGQDEFGRRLRSRHQMEDRSNRGEPTVIRHNRLSPVAPQPAHISSLANPRHAPISVDDIPTTRGTPAQVAALRRNEAANSSPESSPQGLTRAEKRRIQKQAKNKRKADRQAERAPSPYIKPEPRSPSPVSAPAYARPNKRQKQGPGPAQQGGYESPRFEAVSNAGPADNGNRPRAYRDETGATVYERRDLSYAGQAARPILVDESGRQVYDDYEGRYLQRSHMERPVSRGAFVQAAAPIIQRPMSRAYVEMPAQGYASTPRIESRPVYEASRMSMRPPERDRSRSPVARARSPIMAPPSRANAPRRIIVDEYGREYIEPPRPAPPVIQQSIPPVHRRDASDVAYERGPAPLRAVSRMPDTFEQDGVLYRRASSVMPTAPRRVTTQPEYAPVRQSAARVEEQPPSDYEYALRMRPVETVRYEAPAPYDGYSDARGHQLVQPGQQVMRAYSVMPGGEPAPLIHRAVSVRPVEHVPQQAHYGGRQIIRGGEEVTYIERPRGQEVRYAREDVQRDYY